MNGRVYDKLGAPAPFDPSDSFVTSPFLSPRALGLVRLLFAIWTFVNALFVLIWQAVRLHTAGSYVDHPFFRN